MSQASAPGNTAIDVDAVADAVGACPSVAGLWCGKVGEVATYLPGRRVCGIRVTDGAVEVHVVARWVPSLPAVADEVRAAVQHLIGSREVIVFIEEVADDDATPFSAG